MNTEVSDLGRSRAGRSGAGRGALRVLADIVEASAECVVGIWEQEAAAVLDDELWGECNVTVKQLEAEGERILKRLPSHLRSDPSGDRRRVEGDGYILGDGTSAEVDGEISPALKCRLLMLFTDILWRVAVEQAPDDWDAALGSKLERDLKAAVGKVVGMAPSQHVEALERTLRQEQREHVEVLTQMLEDQEQEREQIARDVHDGLAQALAGARYRTDAARRLLPKDVDQAGAEMLAAQELMEYTLSRVRDIISDLRPMTLARFGLRAAVDGYVGRLAQERRMEIAFEGNGDTRRLGAQAETYLYRITEDAFAKILVPSETKSARVELHVTDEAGTLVIEGDGTGLEADDVSGSIEAERGAGVMMMRKRAELVGGSLSVGTEEGHGWRIEVRVPVQNGGA